MSQGARAVILAAGESKRMQGAQKLLLRFRGKPMIDHVIEAAAAWNPVVVASPAVAQYLRDRAGITVIVNDEPALGMSHSLKLAGEYLPPETPLLVLLGDKPLVSAQLIQGVSDKSESADIAHPQRNGEPGHPVFFSAAARARIASLPPGDSLHALRDDPALERRPLDIDDPGAYVDIDTAAALEAIGMESSGANPNPDGHERKAARSHPD